MMKSLQSIGVLKRVRACVSTSQMVSAELVKYMLSLDIQDAI